MVLAKDDKWGKHKKKVDEESLELVEAIGEGDLEHIAEEALDTIQVCIGILDKLYHQGIDIQQAVDKHNRKLVGRGWAHKAVVKIQINR